MKEEIRPIYSELQGYLSQAPKSEPTGWIFDSTIWQQYKQAVDELSTVTGEDYSRFNPEIQILGARQAVGTQSYRTKLSGLISRLHGKYFADEAHPFGGVPNTIVTQQQNQSQSVQIQILLEIQSKIDEKLLTLEEGKEKSFLEKIKESLGVVKSTTELIQLILRTAHDMGLSPNEALALFT